jgi:hypothetical protein
MTNYQITIGYKAVITVDVKAENEFDARKIGLKEFKEQTRRAWKRKNITLHDDNFKVDGCVDMDATWFMYDKK